MLPGLDGTGRLFEPFLSILPPAIEPIVVDYPNNYFMPYEKLEESVLARFPTLLDSTLPSILIAESYSGPLAIRLAARYPQSFKAIALVASFALNPWPAFPAYLATACMHPLWMRYALRSRTLIRLALTGAYSDRALLQVIQQTIQSVPMDLLIRRIRAVLACNETDDLEKCASLPILYLQATRDRLIPPSAVNIILKHHPRTTLQLIHAGHLLLQTQPRQALQTILQFLSYNSVMR